MDSGGVQRSTSVSCENSNNESSDTSATPNRLSAAFNLGDWVSRPDSLIRGIAESRAAPLWFKAIGTQRRSPEPGREPSRPDVSLGPFEIGEAAFPGQGGDFIIRETGFPWCDACLARIF